MKKHKKLDKLKETMHNVKTYYQDSEKPKFHKVKFKREPLTIVRDWNDVPDSLRTRYVQFFSLIFISIAFAIISIFVLHSIISCVIWAIVAFVIYRYSLFLRELFCSDRMDTVAGYVSESVRTNMNKVFNTTSIKVYDEDRNKEITILFQNKHRFRQSKNVHYVQGDYLMVYFDRKNAQELKRNELNNYFTIDRIPELSTHYDENDENLNNDDEEEA